VRTYFRIHRQRAFHQATWTPEYGAGGSGGGPGAGTNGLYVAATMSWYLSGGVDFVSVYITVCFIVCCLWGLWWFVLLVAVLWGCGLRICGLFDWVALFV